MENNDIKYLDMEKYVNTLILIYVNACINLFGCIGVSIDHSINKGLFSRFIKKDAVDEKEIIKIKIEMDKIVKMNLEITNVLMDKEEAIEIFQKQGMEDKVRLFKSIKLKKVNLTKINNSYFNIFGSTYDGTGRVREYDLKPAKGGLVILFPRKEFNYKIPSYSEQVKLFNIYRESESWAELLGVNNVSDLNNIIKNKEIDDLIRVNEALHEKKIALIADEICEANSRVVLIAGPSSSGKTTFMKRLGTQIVVNGKKYFPLSLDNYFIERSKTPLDKNGRPNYDSIKALDIEKFNEDLENLIKGKPVKLTYFDFITGRRSYFEKESVLGENVFLLIEGIHGLNDQLSYHINEKDKYKVYISALTELNIDNHNRISTTELRLIRRMVRDDFFRGHDAEKTLSLWENVVKGENEYIFPFQENADSMFNSSLLYEISVLKKYALPVIKSINKEGEYTKERLRLLKFLDFFLSVENDQIIPSTSIIKEFIGGSCIYDLKKNTN